MDPDDLLVQFQSITTNDHESLILQFSNLLKLDKNAAIFYLESSNWNVETAINHCLSNESAALLQSSIENNTMVQSMPQAKLTNDLSDVQQASFSPLEKVQMVWTFCNTGEERWPVDTRISYSEGHCFTYGCLNTAIVAGPGEECKLSMVLEAPKSNGTFAGCYRLACHLGFFSEPVWIVLNVAGALDTDTSSMME